MSHVATVDVEVKDLDALAEAATRVGLELVRDQNTYRWFGESVGDYPFPAGFTEDELGKCEHALRIVGDFSQLYPDERPYEIGVVRRKDGRPGYQLLWDFWAGGLGLKAKVGEGCAHLKREYAYVIARRAAVAQGFTVNEQRQPNGAIRMVLCK